MTGLPIRLFPDAVLRKPCAPVESFDAYLGKILAQMETTMRSQPHGIGIAAPQVGISRKIAIVDVSARVPGTSKLTLCNPQILAADEEIASREGCMSLPDYTGQLKRFKRITLAWQDERGLRRQESFMGIEAVCIQHEIDHLQGILFLDRVNSLKRDMIPRQFRGKAV